MDHKEDKEITNTELLESINRSFSGIEKRMATKDDLKRMATKEDLLDLKLELKTDIYELRTEIKGFKKDTTDSIEKIEEDVADLTDTVMHQDKRIERLENKFA
ncbi:MAG: hypothetical protein WAN61_00090 [Minisyncoccia bacterium]